MEHMMSTITPKTAFPLLLASCFWDDLHNLVQVSLSVVDVLHIPISSHSTGLCNPPMDRSFPIGGIRHLCPRGFGWRVSDIGSILYIYSISQPVRRWGSEGGKTLTTLFRRLHSPNQLRLS